MKQSGEIIRVAYDATALAMSPHGGIAQVCLHTLRQSVANENIAPTACYLHGRFVAPPAAGIETQKVWPFGRWVGRRFDIAHSLCHRALPVRSRKTVYTVHDAWSLSPNDYQPPAFQKKLGGRMRRDLSRADFVVAISETVRRKLLDFGVVTPDRCSVVPLGIEIPPQPRASVDSPAPKEPFALFVGRLENRKNLGHVLSAVAPIEKLGLVLVGEPGFGYEQNIRSALGLFPANRVTRLSRLSWPDLRALYRSALAIVAPSWEEGFGLPALEAMACGAPVITSNRSASAEVACAGDSSQAAAILVDPDRPDQSEAALRRLLASPEERQDLITRGLRQAQVFSWSRYYAGLMGVYRRLID